MFSDELVLGMKGQNKDFKHEDIKNLIVRIELANGDIYPLCFLINESERFLNIVHTSLSSGREKVVVLNKEYILKVSVVYQDDMPKEEKKEVSDCMFT